MADLAGKIHILKQVLSISQNMEVYLALPLLLLCQIYPLILDGMK
jgi:hypothetical protein